MLASLFSLSLFLAAPLAVLASLHGNVPHNRHVEIAKRHSPDVQLFKRFSSARWTYYDVGLGACGITNVKADFIVALNSDQYGSGYPGPHCFQMITMQYNGLTATAQITDECPGCPYGGLDLSEGLFEYFSPLGTGVLYGTWYFNDGSSGDSGAASSTYVAPTTTKHKTTSSSTWTPPSTTWTPTTTSTSKKQSSTSQTPSSTSTSSSHSSSAAPSSSSSASSSTSKSSASAAPSATPLTTGGTNLAGLSQVILDLGVVVVAGAEN